MVVTLRQIIGFGLLLAANSGVALFLEQAAEGRDFTAVSQQAGSSGYQGVLKRNSADQDGSMPYVLLDRWGMVHCYVSPAQGVVLEPYLGRDVTVQGSTQPSASGPARVGSAVVTAMAGKGKAPQTSTTTPAERIATKAPPPSRENTFEAAGAEELSLPPAHVAAKPAVRPAARGRAVRQVAYQETIPRPAPQPVPVPAPEVLEGPAVGVQGGYGPGGDCGPSCGPDCGASCGPCETDCDACFEPYSPLAGLWVRTDFLLWWMQGMEVPPLLTTGPSANQPGFIDTNGNPQLGTTVLFGHERINDSLRAGGRLRVGTWLNVCRTVGVEGEYFGLEKAGTNFYTFSDGNPILSRPFISVSPTNPIGTPEAEIIALPRPDTGSRDGTAVIDALTRFEGAGVRLQFERCRAGCFDPCAPGMMCGESYRSFFTLGYRFLRLDDSLAIQTTSTITSTQDITALEFDKFETSNQFHGVELGMAFQWRLNRWSLDVTPKISLGTTREVADISGGYRATNVDGTHQMAPGGTLALISNINQYSRNEFAVAPEVEATLGYQVSPHVRATFGYNFLYLSRVARAGDQIDLRVNPDLLPPAIRAAQAGDHPAFAWNDTSFWAQGMNFGLDFRF
jgi:hypothetical protein